MRKTLAAATLLLGSLLALPAQAEDYTVTINNYTFAPAKLSIHAGDKVTWTNQDSTPHTATALDGKNFDSGTIDPNTSWSFVFSKPGVYKYRCAIHPDMQGEVDVQ
jgi:plastocyanin